MVDEASHGITVFDLMVFADALPVVQFTHGVLQDIVFDAGKSAFCDQILGLIVLLLLLDEIDARVREVDRGRQRMKRGFGVGTTSGITEDDAGLGSGSDGHNGESEDLHVG